MVETSALSLLAQRGLIQLGANASASNIRMTKMNATRINHSDTAPLEREASPTNKDAIPAGRAPLRPLAGIRPVRNTNAFRTRCSAIGATSKRSRSQCNTVRGPWQADRTSRHSRGRLIGCIDWTGRLLERKDLDSWNRLLKQPVHNEFTHSRPPTPPHPQYPPSAGSRSSSSPLAC